MPVFGRPVIRQKAIFEKNKTMTAIDGLRQSNLSQPQGESFYGQQQLLLIPNPASGVVKVLLPNDMPGEKHYQTKLIIQR
jgi:hypothetical protein